MGASPILSAYFFDFRFIIEFKPLACRIVAEKSNRKKHGLNSPLAVTAQPDGVLFR